MRLPTSREDGVIERRTHDYDRHGTTTLFAGLIAAVTAEAKVKAGTVVGTCMPRHRAQEFRKFLDEVENVMSRTASTCTRAPQTLTPLRAIVSKTGWVCRGASDHAEDLTSRSLPLQRAAHLRMRLGQRVILLLQLREQARVLDGDHGLVDKDLEQIYLSIRERANSDASSNPPPRCCIRSRPTADGLHEVKFNGWRDPRKLRSPQKRAEASSFA